MRVRSGHDESGEVRSGQRCAQCTGVAVPILADSPSSTAEALGALSAGTPDSVKAVPATEQSIAQSANAAMTTYSPVGATPVADYPAVIVSGSGIDETASRAAAQFADFMREPNQSQLFVGAVSGSRAKTFPISERCPRPRSRPR